MRVVSKNNFFMQEVVVPEATISLLTIDTLTIQLRREKISVPVQINKYLIYPIFKPIILSNHKFKAHVVNVAMKSIFNQQQATIVVNLELQKEEISKDNNN